MSGQLYIDGTDAFTEWGVYVTSGGWTSMVAWPALKKIESNDWQEEDGIEADLDSPVLDTRDVTVTFASMGAAARPFGFIASLMDGAYHEFNCAYIGRTYRLRLSSHPKLDWSLRLSTFSLKLSDDFPLEGYEYAAPSSVVPAHHDYALDEVYLTDYGVRVLGGTLSEVLKMPDVKQNMLRNIATLSGAIYDPQTVTLKTKDVKLKCLMRAGTVEELWANWDALLYDLVRSGERTLYCDDLAQEFPCYYKQCSVSRLNVEGKIWLEFTLTLTFLRDFATEEGDRVLATESGIIVFTEDGEDAIDMTDLL